MGLLGQRRGDEGGLDAEVGGGEREVVGDGCGYREEGRGVTGGIGSQGRRGWGLEVFGL